MTFERAKVMGILNVTPDSFYSESRASEEDKIEERIREIEEQGADIIDIGGCSTRPGSESVSAEEEWARVKRALEIMKTSGCSLPVSLDTFRAEIARRGVEEYGVAIINDISGGSLDAEMFKTVGRLQVPYVLTHMRGTPHTMQQFADYNDVVAEVIKELSWKANELHSLGVNDVIIDPGFGFAKTAVQNFRLLGALDQVCAMGMPVLAGVSRKSFITRALGCEPAEALAGTLAAETIALMKGASILRVHDVKQAVEIVTIAEKTKGPELEEAMATGL